MNEWIVNEGSLVKDTPGQPSCHHGSKLSAEIITAVKHTRQHTLLQFLFIISWPCSAPRSFPHPGVKRRGCTAADGYPYCLHGDTVEGNRRGWRRAEGGRKPLGFDWVTITLQLQTSSDSVCFRNCNVLLVEAETISMVSLTLRWLLQKRWRRHKSFYVPMTSV